MLEIVAKDENGTVIDEESVGVDVSSDWRKFPRYGYLCDFSENAKTYGKVEQLSKYHINVIEYYDWHHLHHQPLAPKEQLDSGVYQDWAGRNIYVNTIKNYIKSSKSKNMACMAYDMIYAEQMILLPVITMNTKTGRYFLKMTIIEEQELSVTRWEIHLQVTELSIL